MFLLRCAFWLSIVYASMSWGGTALHRQGSFESAMANDMIPSGGAARNAALTFCKGREMQCLKDAAAMTDLIKTTLSRGDDGIAPDAGDVPLPPRAPRHHIVTGMLTPHA